VNVPLYVKPPANPGFKYFANENVPDVWDWKQPARNPVLVYVPLRIELVESNWPVSVRFSVPAGLLLTSCNGRDIAPAA